MRKKQVKCEEKISPHRCNQHDRNTKATSVRRVLAGATHLGFSLGAFGVSRTEVKSKDQSREGRCKADPSHVGWDPLLEKKVNQN